MLTNMSFREKSTWISFLLLLSISILYGLHFTMVEVGHFSPGSTFHVFLALVIAFIVGEIALHAFLAMQSPRDARTPKDERERLIDLKATRVAFFALMAGAILVIVLSHLPVNRWEIINAVLLSVVVAELTMLGARIIYYRRAV
jgi:archaellum biogenesis protein FlaJ (TadC family)